MIPGKLIDVLNYEGVVSIVTLGDNGAHVVNTCNSYVKITEDEKLLVPVGRMNNTEANINQNNKVLITLGSREVEGFHSKGTGFLINGLGSFVYEGAKFDQVKQDFPWVRATLEIKPQSITQTL